MSFEDFKKQRKSQNIEKLQEKLESMEQGNTKQYKDDRMWYPQRDKATGKGSAVIRFLPVPETDELTNGIPWVKTYTHAWKNEANGRWYIEECPTTIGGKCPMCSANSDLWNSGRESDKQTARDRKRRLQYIANILVVSDPATPENEGKVFLFKFGKKIKEMIDKKITPEFEEQKAVNVFDFWEGANFALRIGKVAGYTNYDASEFLEKGPIGSDDEIEKIYNSLYGLSEFIDPSKFKSYDDLKDRLDYVMGLKDSPAGASPAPSSANTDSSESSGVEDSSEYDSVDESSVDDEQSEFFSKLSEAYD